MQPPVPQTALYDSVDGNYDQATYQQQQNFGNPYDCPEGMYNGSIMSSVNGYSQVSDHMNSMGPNQSGLPPLPQQHQQQQQQQQHFPPQQQMQHQINQQRQAVQQQMQQHLQQQQQNPHFYDGQNVPGNTDTVIYKGGPPQPRGPLPPTGDDEFPPPPPIRSADTSLNDSNSTTQSNLTSECSEAECDREPLVKNRASIGGTSPSMAKELTTEEMRKLIERNEVVNTNNLTPFDTVNV